MTFYYWIQLPSELCSLDQETNQRYGETAEKLKQEALVIR